MRSKAQRAYGWLELIEGGAEVAAATLAAPFVRRAYNRWGATSAEVAAAMPGDELVRTRRSRRPAVSPSAPAG